MEPKSVKDNTGSMSSLQKAWEVLFPCLLYYLTYSAAYIVLAYVHSVMTKSLGEGYQRFMTDHAATAAGVTGGIGRMFGILPLIPMLNRELLWQNSVKHGAGKAGSGGSMHEKKGVTGIRDLVYELSMTAVLAVCSSLGLNTLLTLTGFTDSSGAYREVAASQYGVAFAAGLILYGVVSPLAEEVVFRGVIYNRMRRFYGPVVAVVASGLLFGAFHGNPVQGVYGGCMGMLMAYLYERSGRFMIPFCFHATANLAVYITAYTVHWQEVLSTPAGCAVLLTVSVGCIFLERRRTSR